MSVQPVTCDWYMISMENIDLAVKLKQEEDSACVSLRSARWQVVELWMLGTLRVTPETKS